MKFPRSAGILLHPTSLPGDNGIGEFGPEALRFLDFLKAAGLKIWQMLPVGPTGYGDSPYQSFSAFAGNPLLIHVRADGSRTFSEHSVEFENVIPHKRALLDGRIASFRRDHTYRAFIAENEDWLPDYALFMALKETHGGVAWTDWAPDLARRKTKALEASRRRLTTLVDRYQIEQYLFFSQFRALKQASAERAIRLMGDLPIYVAHDSADVWSHPDLFQLDPAGHPRVQAGVPPDYFSATGQLWGNPIYDWNAMRADNYRWWIRRMRATLDMFDLVRVDHFRGFEAYWEVPGSATTAVNGHWVEGPGAELFDAMSAALGPLPIVAENLGVITPPVEALREQFGYPGMSVLQFAFGNDSQAGTFLPHSYSRERVVYTGTHDNDTTLGWWNSTGEGDSTRTVEDVEKEKTFARLYFDTDGSQMNWTMIRAAMASVADTVLIPMQDVLGLGSEARMNLPGRESGNWRFRFSWDQLKPAMTRRLRSMVELYSR